MARPIPDSRTENLQFHYIVEWAQKRGFRQTDIATELDIEKSTVGRWFRGKLPTETYLTALAKLLDVRVTDLFIDPEEYAVIELFKGRKPLERSRMISTLETAFPRA